MKKILFSAAMALVLVSCSQDEVIEVNRDGDVIEFGVVANALTRAENIYSSTNLPEEFTVWASYNGKTYIDGDVIKKQGNSWVNTTAVRYWPELEEGEKLTFYAHVNGGDYFDFVPGVGAGISNYVVPTDVAAHKDLLYATAVANEGPVNLHFRHALSQVVFNAKNTNKGLKVVIDGVSVCNLSNENSLLYSSSNTIGPWDDLDGGNTDYSVTFDQITVGTGATPLTSANDDGKTYSSNAMLLLPQKTTAWTPTGNVKPSDASQTGSYFLVKCAISNVADGDETMLWGTKNDDGTYVTKEIAIPAAFDWFQGYKYLYTFVFGNGNGGYDPEDNTPVLTPIDFTISVDDFVLVTQPDTPMKTN
jgi:hypothetical protein